ncbi:MAG: hypothetical protein AAF485_13755 [Chloroflexota bacterium]
MNEQNHPLHPIRVGAIKAAIWQNQSENGRPYFTTSLTRNYRDSDGNWHETTSHFPDDLPRVELAAKKAYEFIHERMADRPSEKLPTTPAPTL